MSWWRKRDPQPAVEDLAADPHLPVIRLDHVSRIFKGDADEETRALDDVTRRYSARRVRVGVRAVRVRQVDVLSILALLDTPTSGRYWLNGRATAQLSPGARARVRNIDVGLSFRAST